MVPADGVGALERTSRVDQDADELDEPIPESFEIFFLRTLRCALWPCALTPDDGMSTEDQTATRSGTRDASWMAGGKWLGRSGRKTDLRG